MSQEYSPLVNVSVNPRRVSKGQMISITCQIIDRYTLVPMPFETIFMEIIDEDGIPVWPLSLVDEEVSEFSKLISTADMDAGRRYTVRISPSRKLRPLGEAIFEIDSDIIDPAFLVPGILLIPKILLREKEVVIPQSTNRLQIAWLIYKTERDSKVCQYCRPHEGERYRPDDPELVRIPVHKNCRCHYDIITVEVEKEIFQAYYRQLATVSQIYEDHFNAGAAALLMWSKK